MNRNCLFSKAVALLLCAVLLIGYLPSIALPAAAATNDEWEGEPDVVETTTGPEGAQDNPIVLTDLENSLEIAANTTVYYSCSSKFNGTNMTVTGTTGYEVLIGEVAEEDTEGTFTYANVTADRDNPFVFAIHNATDAAVTYQVNFAFPTGSSANAEVIGADWDYTATIKEGNEEGYYYTYTATMDGILQVIVSNETGWQYNITNNTTSANDTHTSEDGAAYTYESAVTAGDEISIIVNTYDSANPYTAPAGTVNVRVQYKPGTEANPILLTDLVNNVNVPAGETVYYHGNFSGMMMTVGGTGNYIYGGENKEIDGTAIAVDSGSFWSKDIVVAIENTGDAAADYTINFEYPLGHQQNPEEIGPGLEYTASLEEGNEVGYYFNYTAEKDGTLLVHVSVAETVPGYGFTVNNVTAGSYGDQQWSDSSPVNPYSLEVTTGDLIEIIVCTNDPSDYSYPAGDVTVRVEYKPGTEPNPILLTDLSNTVTVPAGQTVYYHGNFSGMLMTVSGEGSYIYNGENAPIEGEAIAVDSGSFWSRDIVVAIVNDGETDAQYTINFEYPLGTQDNPATAVLGDNSATFAEESDSSYFFTYKAEQDGTLILNMTSEAWTYTVNNMTTGAYGDQKFSDTNADENPCEIAVTAGDELQILVSTYDPALWSWPAGTVSFNLSYKAEGPIVDENLKFMKTSLSFQEYIGLQGILKKSVYDSYDSLYVEAVQATPDGDVKEIIPATPYGSSYYVFDKQILSWAMTENVTITIYAEKDGVQYQSVPFTTSVKTWAMQKIEEYYASNKLSTCRVLVDMLNYGAEVQKAFSHNASNLANADLGDYSNLGTAETPTISADNTITGSGTVSVYKPSISMQAKVEIQVIFKGDISAYEARYTVDGVTTTIPSSDFVTQGSYTVVRVAIKAANMRKVHDFALYDAATGEPVTATYHYNVEAFAEDQLGKTYNDVVIAMMKYGDSVAAIG